MTTAIKRNKPVLFILLSINGRHGGHGSPRHAPVNVRTRAMQTQRKLSLRHGRSPHVLARLKRTLVSSEFTNKRSEGRRHRAFCRTFGGLKGWESAALPRWRYCAALHISRDRICLAILHVSAKAKTSPRRGESHRFQRGVVCHEREVRQLADRAQGRNGSCGGRYH